MKNIAFACFLFIISLAACSKKSVPSKEKEAETTSKPAVVYRAPVKTPTPKSITVSDVAAKKTVDGRYYYDLEGKRYWRNKKDGKYYLYYKGMFDNKDFQ